MRLRGIPIWLVGQRALFKRAAKPTLNFYQNWSGAWPGQDENKETIKQTDRNERVA